MSISSENRQTTPVLGTGANNQIPFTFKVFAASDLLVVAKDLDGVEHTLTLTTDYTVSLNANQDTSPGGTITTTSFMTTDWSYTATSKVPNFQTMTLTNLGRFFPRVLNDMADRCVILVQQILNGLNRSLKFPLSDGTTLNPQLPSADLRKGKFLAFSSATGEPVMAAGGVTGVPVTSYAATLLDDTSALEARTTLAAASAVSVNSAVDQGLPGDTTTNVTAKLLSALNVTQHVLADPVAPYGTYRVGDMLVPSSKTIRGFAGMTTEAVIGNMRPLFKRLAGALTVFDVRLQKGVRFSGIAIDCVDGTANGISGEDSTATTKITADNFSIYNARNGIGGINASNDKDLGYMHGMYAEGGYISKSANNGINNPIDSVFVRMDVADSTLHAVNFGGGASDNTIGLSKLQQNTGRGINCLNSNHNNAVGLVVDRNGKAGVTVSGGAGIAVGVCCFRRNGALSSATLADDCHISIQGTYGSVMGLLTTDRGPADDNSGYDSPKHTVYFDGSTGNHFVLMASDARGYNGLKAWRYKDSGRPSNLVQFGNLGLAPEIRQDNRTNAKTRSATAMANNGSGLIRVTCANHGLETGDTVTIASTVGTTEANGRWEVTYVTDNTFDLNASTFVNAYTSGGTITFVQENFYLVGGAVSIERLRNTVTAASASKAVNGATNNGSGLVRLGVNAHGYSTGDQIIVQGVAGTTEANNIWTVTVIDANNIDLQGSTFTNAYTSGGTTHKFNSVVHTVHTAGVADQARGMRLLMVIVSRNNTTGVESSTEIPFTISRHTGAATLTWLAERSPSTSGFFATALTAGGATVFLRVSNASRNYGIFDLTVYNLATASHSYTINIQKQVSG